MSSAKNPIERLEATHRQLKAMRRRFQRSTWITAIIGFGLLALVAAYFAYGYTEISDFRNPDLLVALVGDAVDQAIPEIRRSVEAEVNNNAPLWAEQVSQQVVAMIPVARRELEDYTCRKADAIIEQLDVMGEKEFRRLLAENRPAVEEAIRQVKEGEELSGDIAMALEQALEKELKVSMEDQAELLLALLKELNKNMKALQASENLDEEQQAERRVLMLAKRLQVERFGDLRLDELAPQAVTEAVQELERARLGSQAAARAKAASAAAADATQVEIAADAARAEIAADAPKGETSVGSEAEPPKADEPQAPAPQADESKPEKPKPDKPKADKPKADPPKDGEPKADEPKPDEPEAAQPKPDKPEAKAPQTDDSKPDTPKAEEPKAEGPKAEEPKAEEAKEP